MITRPAYVLPEVPSAGLPDIRMYGGSTETVAFQVYEILKNNLTIKFLKYTLSFHIQYNIISKLKKIEFHEYFTDRWVLQRKIKARSRNNRSCHKQWRTRVNLFRQMHRWVRRMFLNWRGLIQRSESWINHSLHNSRLGKQTYLNRYTC